MRRIKLFIFVIVALLSFAASADIQQRISIFTQQAELFRQICYSPSGVFLKDQVLIDIKGSIQETVMDCNAQALALEEERLAIEAALQSESCQEETATDQDLLDLLKGSSGIVTELACPGINNAAECLSGMACNLLTSIIPAGRAAARFAFKNHPKLSQCRSGTNCFSNIGKAIWDNLWDTVTGIYELGKMGLSWLGDQLGSLWEAEDATSTRGIAATEISDSQLDLFLQDPIDYVFNFGSRVISMIADGISSRYGCAEWTGTAHLSECVRPMSWECANCSEKLNMVCGVSSYIGSTFITAFFTGGATAAVQMGGKIAASTTVSIAKSIPGAASIADKIAGAGRLTRVGELINGPLKDVWAAVQASRTVQSVAMAASQVKAGVVFSNTFARNNILLYAVTQDAVVGSIKAYNRLATSAFHLGYQATGKAANDARNFLYAQYPKVNDLNSGKYQNVTSAQEYLQESIKTMPASERAHMRIRTTTDAKGESRAIIYDNRKGMVDLDYAYNFTPELPPQNLIMIPPPPMVIARQSINSKKIEFTDEWSRRTATTPAENRIYINEALRGRTPGVIYLDTQNTSLKFLNDTLRDKSLIDAFGNRYNNLVQTALVEFKRKYPDIKISTYSDYKSMRVTIRGPPGKENELMRELGKLTDNAGEGFLTELRASGLVSEAQLSERWFHTGLGRTGDEANLVTRFSRHQADKSKIQEEITSAWQNTEKSRVAIEKRFKDTPLLKKVSNSEIEVPTAEVFEVLRKNTNPAEVARILSRRTSTNVSSNDAKLLREYFDQVDQFSPGLLIAERTEHRFSEAVNGGFSIDFAGVGSFNAEATAIGLAQGKNLGEAITAVRNRERLVTKDLDALKERTENAVKETLSRHGINARISVSGDDMLVVPDAILTNQIRREISEAQVRAVAGTSTRPSGMRTSFFSEKIPNQTSRSIQATIGESVEKKLRKRLENTLSPEELRDTFFAVDMRGHSPGAGPVKLEIVNPNLKRKSRVIIEQEFNKALQEVNKELINAGQGGTLMRLQTMFRELSGTFLVSIKIDAGGPVNITTS